MYTTAPVVDPETSVLNTNPMKEGKRNLTWTNVNFAVGDKKILTDCWGSVSLLAVVIFYSTVPV